MEKRIPIALFALLMATSCTKNDPVPGDGMIINHECIDLSAIPDEWIEKAKESLHIAYGHTSHGSQITTGMTGLVGFRGEKYAWNNGGTGGALDLHDYAMSGDLGNPDRTSWEQETRTYLNANDACSYDSNGDGSRDANWAIDWQNSHTEGDDWYNCSSAHSQPLNANMKAYAAWYLWARIAGWD